MIAQNRVQYLKEIDRRQPIAITSKSMGPLIQSVSERIHDAHLDGARSLGTTANGCVRAAMFAPLSRGIPIKAAAALAWFQRSKPPPMK